jgi:DNA-binding FrmR family transcriptional regulator
MSALITVFVKSNKIALLIHPYRGDRTASMTEHRHESHPEIVKRLKRAEGHLKSVIAMIASGRPCLDIAQQLHAVEKAIAQAKRTLIQDHLDHCLEETIGALPRDRRQSIDEFKSITKYL